MHNFIITIRTLAALAALLILTAAFSPTPALAQVWQASTDFSTVQGYRNWRYMTYLPDSGGTYEPMVYGLNVYGFDSWHYEPLYGDYIVEGLMHPSSLETARVWDSPVAGTVRVTGTVAKGDPGGGDGVYVTIWKNDALLWDAIIAFNDLVGYSYDLPVDVKMGDWLIFRVSRLRNHNYDATVFDPRIAVESLDSSAAGSWIEAVLRDYSSYVQGLTLPQFEGATTSAKAGRRLAISHGLTVAANLVAKGNITAAMSELWGVSVRLDGDPSPADWMVDGPEKEALYADIQQLIYLLGLL